MITICRERLMPDMSGALWVPGHETLIVSDLHLEKGSSFAKRGIALPPYDTRQTIFLLMRLMRRYSPKRVVSLGDSFHDPEGPSRMSAADRDAVKNLTSTREWIWIAGNHEGLVDDGDLGGQALEEMELGRLILRHEPQPAPATGEISGHLHPCAVLRQRGRSLRRRCFVTDNTRLVMPAFGAFTGGLNVLDPAFAPIFDKGFRAWLLGEQRTYPIQPDKLVPDTMRSPATLEAPSQAGAKGKGEAKPEERKSRHAPLQSVKSSATPFPSGLRSTRISRES